MPYKYTTQCILSSGSQAVIVNVAIVCSDFTTIHNAEIIAGRLGNEQEAPSLEFD